eukprot:gene23824-30097_t
MLVKCVSPAITALKRGDALSIVTLNNELSQMSS